MTRTRHFGLGIFVSSCLGLVGCDDGGSPAGADLATPDLATAADLATAPDLAPGPDLEVGPDLALPVEWAARTSNTTKQLYAVWGSGAQDLYVVGEAGTVLHSTDGMSWTAQDSGTSSTLRSVWGAGANDVYAAGDAGTLIHSNGNQWTAIATAYSGNQNANYYAVYGVAANDVFVAGSNGLILESTDGGKTFPELPPLSPSPVTTPLRTIWGSGQSIWVGGDAGNLVLHTNAFGNWEWRLRSISSPENIQGMFALSTTSLYLVSDDGSVRYSFDGLIWPRDSGTPTTPMRGIWGSGAGDIYAVGDNGVILHQAVLHKWTAQGSGTARRLNAVWGSGAADVYVVGESGTILHK